MALLFKYFSYSTLSIKKLDLHIPGLKTWQLGVRMLEVLLLGKQHLSFLVIFVVFVVAFDAHFHPVDK